MDLEVEDMPSVGHKYTWYRLKSGWIGFLCLLNGFLNGVEVFNSYWIGTTQTTIQFMLDRVFVAVRRKRHPIYFFIA